MEYFRFGKTFRSGKQRHIKICGLTDISGLYPKQVCFLKRSWKKIPGRGVQWRSPPPLPPCRPRTCRRGCRGCHRRWSRRRWRIGRRRGTRPGPPGRRRAPPAPLTSSGSPGQGVPSARGAKLNSRSETENNQFVYPLRLNRSRVEIQISRVTFRRQIQTSRLTLLRATEAKPGGGGKNRLAELPFPYPLPPEFSRLPPFHWAITSRSQHWFIPLSADDVLSLSDTSGSYDMERDGNRSSAVRKLLPMMLFLFFLLSLWETYKMGVQKTQRCTVLFILFRPTKQRNSILFLMEWKIYVKIRLLSFRVLWITKWIPVFAKSLLLQ